MGELAGVCLRNSPFPRETWSYPVAPSRCEHRSDVCNHSNTNQGPVSVLRSREAAMSKGDFYWILLAATDNLTDKFFEGGSRGWGHMFYM